MATAHVFNGNINQSIYSLKKQMQRDQLMAKLRFRAHHLSKTARDNMKKKECFKRHARKKAMKGESL